MSGGDEREYVLVSMCLLGIPSRYHGEERRFGRRIGRPALIKKLLEHHAILPLCPEQLGGLRTPRAAAHIEGRKVITDEGEDVTEQFFRGATLTLRLCRLFDVKRAYLLKDSPSCGRGGVTAEVLAANDIMVRFV